MLQETTDIVRQKIAAGKTLEQIKSEGLPEEWKPWGTGFIKPISGSKRSTAVSQQEVATDKHG